MLDSSIKVKDRLFWKETASDVSKLTNKEVPTHISLTKTAKAMNKQLQNGENSSGKALDYNEEALETLCSKKTQDGPMEKYKLFYLCYLIP